MTTAIVRMDVNIDMAIGLVISKKIEPKNYLLGFNENGLGLAPYRSFESKISPENKAKIAQLIDGDVGQFLAALVEPLVDFDDRVAHQTMCLFRSAGK